MANTASINPTPDQLFMRNICRIERLRAAIEKAEKKQSDQERINSLRDELSRRLASLEIAKQMIDKVTGSAK